MTCYAEVILPLPVSGMFTYRIPGENASGAIPGMRVTVQFGRKRMYTGVIRKVHNHISDTYAVKDILSLPDDVPVVDENQFLLWEWISEYYMCSLGEVFKAAMPSALKVESQEPPEEKAGRKRRLKKTPGKDMAVWQKSEPAQLNPPQNKALEEIRNAFGETEVVLLHGVTSSGKTEIYIRLIEETLRQGKQVLYLLPEIALTTQIIARLQSAFGKTVAAYHSKLNKREKMDTWNRLLKAGDDNKIQVVLGARSSVFLPFRKAGLIIVDEEHENTFKQFDPAPRYHARDTAIMLARIHGAKVLLGTATPSIETYYNCNSGKYSLVNLPDRFGDMELPEIRVVNTRELKRKKRMQSHFSPMLLDSVTEALQNKEQVILFQNRRGFSLYLECKQCGDIPRCRHCDVSLTYHKLSNRITCHYCGFGMAVPKVCSSCGNPDLKMQGFGTEKIEEEIALFFPSARVARMDLDTTRKRRSFDQLISRFELRESDILVGTQMVSKGLDFGNVRLVGIVNADTMLNYPDFRAQERGYQLMAQVSGRSGRKNKRGIVIIQTSDEKHPVIDQVVRNDFEGMYRTQLEERKRFLYPPFYRLIEITLKHRDREVLDKAADFLLQRLRLATRERILGPEYPLVSRIQNLNLKRLLIKISKGSSLPGIKKGIAFHIAELSEHPMFRSVIPVIDVDPY